MGVGTPERVTEVLRTGNCTGSFGESQTTGLVMNRVEEFQHLVNYLVYLRFKDGLKKVVDFRPILGKGFTA
jgi:hypothetical protein